MTMSMTRNFIAVDAGKNGFLGHPVMIIALL
jgi:hypothetical protein